MDIFTYGTLMFPEVWQAVVGREFSAIEASLRGYTIFRVRDAEYPGMVVSGPETIVRGVLRRKVDDASMARLDRFEGSFYRRQPVLVHCKDGAELQAETYIVSDENRTHLLDEVWQREDFISRGGPARFMARYEGFRRLLE